MRTVRCSGRRGVSAQEGVCLGGVSTPVHAGMPPPPRGQNY